MHPNHLHFERKGNGSSTIVFVHGLTCAHTDWSRQVRYLETQADCIAVDLRGHGKSTHLPPIYDIETLASDVIDLCQEIDIASALFVGHSMGTRVIASVTQQAPELVKGLVFVDGSKFADGDPAVVRQSVLDKLGDDQNTTAFIKTMFSQMFVAPGNPVEKQTILDRATNTNPAFFRQLLSNMFAWDAANLVPALSQISQPVSVIQSTTMNEQRERRSLRADESTAYLETIAACIPHAEISVVPGVGHFTQLDAADLVSRTIEQVLPGN